MSDFRVTICGLSASSAMLSCNSESSSGSQDCFPRILVTAAGACWPHFSNKTDSLFVFQMFLVLKESCHMNHGAGIIFIHFSRKNSPLFRPLATLVPHLHSSHIMNWTVFFKYLKLRLKEINLARQLATEIWNSVSRTQALLNVVDLRTTLGWEQGLRAVRYGYHIHHLCYGVGLFLESDGSQPFLGTYYGPGDPCTCHPHSLIWLLLPV